MDDRALSLEDVNNAVRDLVQKNRARCLWFAPPDYQPETDAERIRALSYIERHGDREAFVRARELQQWLLRTSKET